MSNILWDCPKSQKDCTKIFGGHPQCYPNAKLDSFLGLGAVFWRLGAGLWSLFGRGAAFWRLGAVSRHLGARTKFKTSNPPLLHLEPPGHSGEPKGCPKLPKKITPKPTPSLHKTTQVAKMLPQVSIDCPKLPKGWTWSPVGDMVGSNATWHPQIEKFWFSAVLHMRSFFEKEIKFRLGPFPPKKFLNGKNEKSPKVQF